MKKHIPNFITLINLIIGCEGIYYTLVKDESEAFYFVMAAGLFDFFDGFAARILKVKSEVGKHLDSLADLVSFGLLPSFFMLKQMQSVTDYFWIAILIVVFSAIRLAKFNVSENQTDTFKGLPTPANAMMLTSLTFVPFNLYGGTLISICIFSSMLLTSPIRLLSFKFSSFGWSDNEARWLLIIGSLILISVFKWTFMPLLIPLYIIVSIISFVGKNE